MKKTTAPPPRMSETAMDWAARRREDPAHRDAIEALMTELDVRQDLVALREKAGLTQVELARRVGVTQPVIARLERDRTKDIKLSTLVSVAAALGARVKIAFEKMRAAAKPKARKRAAA